MFGFNLFGSSSISTDTPQPTGATTNSMPSNTTSLQTPNNAASDLKPQGETAAKVKPCCVCKDEKSARDECMLFSTASDPQEDCKDMVSRYKSCMAGYGFTNMT